MKKPPVTIGIPAYNEQDTIGRILSDIKRQCTSDFRISEILVYSDGSTDSTAATVRQFRGLPVKIIDSRTRKGKASAINTIFQKAKGDIVVLFDADISLIDTDTISKLIQDIAAGKADLSGARVAELPVRNVFQQLLKSSMEYKRSLFTAFHSGNNIYTCHGRARAFSKKLFRSIRFTHSTNEDAYSYLYCIRHGFRYTYIPDAAVYYALPETLNDHERQSIRFFQSRHASDKEFGKEYVDTAYAISPRLTVSTLLQYAVKDPYILPYLALSLYLSVKSHFVRRETNTWNVATSSKNISKEAKL